MQSVEHFLAHSIKLETEAARRYEELAAAMATEGNTEVKAFFSRMAFYSRKHLAEATARSGFRDLPKLAASEMQWPDGISPEVADWVGVDGFLEVRRALMLAYESEQRGHAYYAAIAASTDDIELKALAQEFADEEAGHMVELAKLIEACPA